jgi:integrase
MDYNYNGRRYRKIVGNDKKMADLILKNIEIQIVKGNYLGVTEKKKILFEVFAEMYLEYAKVNKTPSSYRGDYQHMKADLLPFFSGKFLNNISTRFVEEFKNRKASTGKLVSTNRCLALLKHMFSMAAAWGYITTSPAKSVKLFKENKGRVRYLTQLEIERLLKELRGMSRSIVITALNTGMRKGEIQNLKWRDIDLFNNYISIEYSKNGESRKIPLNSMLRQELMNLPRYGDYVFSKPNGEPYGDPRTAFENALKRAGIDNFHFHDLRHTFASHLAMSGVDIRTIAALLGHKTLQMTMRYSHLSPGYLQDAVSVLSEKYLKKGTNIEQLVK